MAFLATNIIPKTIYDEVKKHAAQMRKGCLNYIAKIDAGQSLTADQIINLTQRLRWYRDRFNLAKSTDGIVDYATTQEDKGDYDVIAEFTAMLSAIEAVITWVYNCFPTSAEGYIEAHMLAMDGTLTIREFSPAQLSGWKTSLQALADSVS